MHRKPPLWASISRMVHSTQLFFLLPEQQDTQEYSTAVQALHCTDCIRVVENAAEISAVPDWGQCFHRSHPTLLTAVTPAPLQKKKIQISVTASEAAHETIRAKRSRFSTTNVAVIICKDGRTGLVLQGQRQPCCSSFFYYYLLPRTRGKGEVSAGGRTTRRTVGQRFAVEATHTHPPLGQRGSGGRLGSVSHCLRLLLSPLPPLPRRTDRRRENARNETSAQALFTCALTN